MFLFAAFDKRQLLRYNGSESFRERVGVRWLCLNLSLSLNLFFLTRVGTLGT
jgi:hypothetical protein